MKRSHQCNNICSERVASVFEKCRALSNDQSRKSFDAVDAISANCYSSLDCIRLIIVLSEDLTERALWCELDQSN